VPSLLSSHASFQEAAQAMIHAVALLSFGSTESDAVTSAWQAVKVI
jgi:Zn-dependent metalloprotease